MIDNIVKKKEGELSLVTWIKRRIKRNQNCIALFEGPTGSGKSLTCMSVAKSIDSDFDPSTQIVFYLSDFMKLINSEDFGKKKYKIIIFEELQVSASNRNWQSAMNKMLNYVLSTFRHQNIILLFNSPYRDFLDSQSMKLLHLIIQMKSIDRKRNKAKIKPLIQQYNSKMKKTYEHSLFVLNDKGQGSKLAFMNVSKPDSESIEIYEAKKREFTEKLNREILLQAEELERKGSKIIVEEKEEPLHQLNANELMVYDWIKNNPDKLQKDYAKDLKLTGNKVSVLIRKIHKKGVNVRKYLKIHDNSKFFNNNTIKDGETD
jgi:DNA polymerase III delta prime subunit